MQDFAQLKHFGFKPQAPQSEVAFKQAYAKVASAAGLTKEAAVKIYGFESGGDGKYDVQAGLEYETPGAHAISTALGYNQLLSTNSVESTGIVMHNLCCSMSLWFKLYFRTTRN